MTEKIFTASNGIEIKHGKNTFIEEVHGDGMSNPIPALKNKE